MIADGQSRATGESLTPELAIEQFTLDNGLRVVVNPDPASPAVAIVVSYDVGFRSEPPERPGFAHLFEHLMFTGSEHVGPGEHASLVAMTGGTYNGYTRQDCTTYIETLPCAGLELGLYLEADRMRGLRLDPRGLAQQVGVVEQEIRQNILNAPYGGFPWVQLPPVMFHSFANAHNGYGDFEHLAAADLNDAADFFSRYYSPANAVLAVAGDVSTSRVRALAHQNFGDIAPRPTPPRQPWSEPWPQTERRGVHRDPMAARPALAVGYRVPDPVADPAGLLTAIVACALLVDGDDARLPRRVVQGEQLAFRLSGQVGFFDPFDARDPTVMQLVFHYADPDAGKPILAAVDAEIERLADQLEEPELAATRLSLVAGYLHRLDSLGARARLLALFEQQRGIPQLVSGVAPATLAVTRADVAAFCHEWLRPERRAVLELIPGAGPERDPGRRGPQ